MPRVLEYSSLKDLFQNPIFRWRFFATHSRMLRSINENFFLSNTISFSALAYFYIAYCRDLQLSNPAILAPVIVFFIIYSMYYFAAWWFILRDKSKGILHDISYTSISMKELVFGYIYPLFISRSAYMIFLSLLITIFPPVNIPEIRYLFIFLLIVQVLKLVRKPRLGIITSKLLFSTTNFADFFKVSFFLFSPIVAQSVFILFIFWLLTRMNNTQAALGLFGIIAVSIVLIAGIIGIQYIYYRFNTRTYNRLAAEFDNFDEMLMYQIWEAK